MAQRVAVRARRGARFLVAQQHALRASVAAARAQAVLNSAHQVGRDVVTPAQGAKGVEVGGQCVSEARSLPPPSPSMLRAVACVEGAGRAHAEQPRGEGGRRSTGGKCRTFLGMLNILGIKSFIKRTPYLERFSSP